MVRSDVVRFLNCFVLSLFYREMARSDVHFLYSFVLMFSNEKWFDLMFIFCIVLC